MKYVLKYVLEHKDAGAAVARCSRADPVSRAAGRGQAQPAGQSPLPGEAHADCTSPRLSPALSKHMVYIASETIWIV